MERGDYLIDIVAQNGTPFEKKCLIIIAKIFYSLDQKKSSYGVFR